MSTLITSGGGVMIDVVEEINLKNTRISVFILTKESNIFPHRKLFLLIYEK
jgi:hypothetical protein